MAPFMRKINRSNLHVKYLRELSAQGFKIYGVAR